MADERQRSDERAMREQPPGRPAPPQRHVEPDARVQPVERRRAGLPEARIAFLRGRPGEIVRLDPALARYLRAPIRVRRGQHGYRVAASGHIPRQERERPEVGAIAVRVHSAGEDADLHRDPRAA